MSDYESGSDVDSAEPSSGNKGTKVIAAVVAVVIVGIGIALLTDSSHKNDAAIQALTKELDAESATLSAQREKLVELSNHVEALKKQIDNRRVSDLKRAVEQYKVLAAQQRAQRDEYMRLAGQYNEKVAQLRKLQE